MPTASVTATTMTKLVIALVNSFVSQFFHRAEAHSHIQAHTFIAHHQQKWNRLHATNVL